VAAGNVEQKALSLVNTFERAGKKVSRITVEGRRIEIELHTREEFDEFEGIDMRHDKT
jgi:hypothetical protein